MKETNRTWLGMLLASMMAFGCGGDAHDNDVKNTGRVCLHAAAEIETGEQRYDADSPVHLEVSLGECLSACIQNEEASCVAVAEAPGEDDLGSLRIESEFLWDDPSEEACIAVCRDLQARCASEELVAGSYLVSHQDDSALLHVPSTLDEPLCFGD